MKNIFFIVVLVSLIKIASAQTYRQMFDKLDITFQTQPHSFYTQISGTLGSNATLMSSYLNMYEATQDIKYLNEFVICSKRVMDRRDDFINSSTYITDANYSITCDKGNTSYSSNVAGVIQHVMLNDYKAWSRIEFSDACLPEPYPNFKESGEITFPMARFVLLIMENSNLSSLMIPYEVNSVSNSTNYGNAIVINMGEYANWLKSRVYETLNFHYINDWDDWAGRFVTDYSDGKGYNLQCAIGRTLIIMNYIANIENDIATVSGYTNVIEKIAAYLYDNIHANIPTNPATVGNGLTWYTWQHYEGDTLIEDISHAMLDIEFAELYMDYFHPISGYGRFDITDMRKFANGFANRVIFNPLDLRMNTYGTNCNCNQMCCDCDVNIRNGNGSDCENSINPPQFYNFAVQAYIFLTKYNYDIYQQICDFYMVRNSYEGYANVSALNAYSLLAKYENLFNPIAVKRYTFVNSQWAGCAGGDFDGDGREEFATARNKDGAIEIYNIIDNDSINQLFGIINHPNNWAGIAAGNIDGLLGDEIVAVNNGDNSIYLYEQNGTNIMQVAGYTTTYNNWTGIAVGNVLNSLLGNEIVLLREDGFVAVFNFVNGNITSLVNLTTNIGSSVGIAIGNFDINIDGDEIAIINNINGHLNIYKLDNTNGYSLQLINSFTATNGTYNDWNGITAGDYDNDGQDEIIAHRNFDGDFFVFKISNGQLLNNYKEGFPSNTQHGVMGTTNFKGKDALIALRNYDGNMFAFTLDGYCQGLEISSDINENNSIDNSMANTNNEYTIDYHSNNTITVSNMTIAPSVGSNENVDAVFVSGKEIIFKPGFEVKAGATMHAYIDPVNYGCDNNFNLKSLTSNQQTNDQNFAISHKGTPNISDKNQTIETSNASMLNASTQFKMSLAPNPNQGLFEVKLQGNSENGKIVIYDCLSRPISEYNASSNSQLIDLTEQPSGIYIVKYYDNKVTEIGRILKH